MPPPLTSMAQALACSNTLLPWAVALVRAAGTFDHGELGRDPVAPKNLAAFLTALAETAPRFAAANISMLLEHLQGEV
jgi:hypothetical protein